MVVVLVLVAAGCQVGHPLGHQAGHPPGHKENERIDEKNGVFGICQIFLIFVARTSGAVLLGKIVGRSDGFYTDIRWDVRTDVRWDIR